MKPSLWLSGLALSLATAAANAAQTVDIMVLYTKGATESRNGLDIDARIASYIEFANTAYKKSGVDLQLRLVHKQLLDWASYPDVTGNNLSRFKDDAQVQRLREQYGADVVSLINLAANEGGGYITCGIGYMGTGEKNSDRFYSWAKDIAYNLVGVDCGLNTFAHEAGHNMGLRHSYEQDQQEGYYQNGGHSGTHEWSRGYGVSGQFSTIMAYPHAFGARNQAPFFSNPNVTTAECANQPCGMSGRADAVRALNTMGTQIVEFRPTKVPDTDNPGDGDGGTTNPPTDLPWCSKPALKGLVANGEFATLDGWRALFGQSDLSVVNVAQNCRDNAGQLDARAFDALVTPVSGMKAGSEYRLSAKLRLKAANSRQYARLAILQEGHDGRLSYSAEHGVRLSITGNEFSRLEKTFTFKGSNARNLYVALWTDNGSSLLADEVALVEVGTTPTTPTIPTTPNRVGYDFESGIGGWAGFHGSARVTRFARGGRQALEAYARKYEGSGASVSLLGNVDGGQRYSIKADLALGRDSRLSGMVYGYLYIEDATGRGQYLSLGYLSVKGGSWATLQKEVQLPAGKLKRADLLLLGTQRAQSLYIDNVDISKL